MKKLWKKLLAITTAVMMVVTLLPAMARASTASENAVIKDNFDLSQKGSITIHKTSQDANEPLKDAGFTLYKLVSFKAMNDGTIVVDEEHSVENSGLKGNINLIDFKTILSNIPENAKKATNEYKDNDKVIRYEEKKTNENGDETLTVWCWDPTFNIYAMEQAEKIYQKDHPDFKLDIQENIYNDIETKLITAATSGDYSTLPDIFLMQDYSFHKNIANFPGIFTELTDSGIDFSQFTEGKLADSTAEGKNYGLPFDNGATIMAIRSDMVEAAGLTVDDFKDTTWSQFEELAKKVVEANGVPMIASSGGSELLMEMLQSAGASPIVDGKVHIADNEALKKTMEVYKKLVDEGIIAEYTDWDQYIASMNDGKTAGVINGCWIMSSIQAAEDQSGKWAIVNMPKLDGVDGATNYANCGGASWAVSSNCKNTELAFDFLKSTFGSSVELYDDLLPNAGAIASYIPAAQSDVYNQASDFYGGQAVYKDIVGYAGSVPAFDCGAYYSDIRSALTDAITNVVQNNADIDGEMNNAQETLEFNIEN